MGKNERYNHEAMPDKGLCFLYSSLRPIFNKKDDSQKIPAAILPPATFPQTFPRVALGAVGWAASHGHGLSMPLHAYYHCMILVGWEANRIERASLVVTGSTVQ